MKEILQTLHSDRQNVNTNKYSYITKVVRVVQELLTLVITYLPSQYMHVS